MEFIVGIDGMFFVLRVLDDKLGRIIGKGLVGRVCVWDLSLFLGMGFLGGGVRVSE